MRIGCAAPSSRELMSKAKTWIIIVVSSVIAAAARMIVGPAIAGGAFVPRLPDRDRDHFHDRRQPGCHRVLRGLRPGTRTDPSVRRHPRRLHPASAEGDRTRVDQQFNGMLSEGIGEPRTLYTYTVTSTDSKGNGHRPTTPSP